MQAVILAAGRGTRMGELTLSVPKPMLVVDGKSLLEHKLDALPPEITEIIFIVNYFSDTIRKHFGDTYNGLSIRYVEQKELNGTGGALWAAKDILKDHFIVMNGDDLYTRTDIANCIKHEWAVLVLKVAELGSAANVVLNSAGTIQEIIEKEKHSGGPGLSNAGLYVLDTRIFTYPLVKRPKSEEYGLPQTIVQAASDIPIYPVEASSVMLVTAPEDIEKARVWLAQHGD